MDQWSKAPEEVEAAPAVDIGAMAPSALAAAGGGGGGGGGGGRVAGTGAAKRPPLPQKPAAAGEEGGRAFKIDKPSTQRTGGKKNMSKRLTSACSLI